MNIFFRVSNSKLCLEWITVLLEERSKAIVEFYLDVSHGSVVSSVGGDDDIDALNDTLEGQVKVLHVNLQF